MFEWAPELPIMDYMRENEGDKSNEDNYESELIEEIVE